MVAGIAQKGLEINEVIRARDKKGERPMKAYTKELKEMRAQDIRALRGRNNSKDADRTPEQIAQSRADKRNAYVVKWEHLQKTADTAAQKSICAEMLQRIINM